MNKLKSYFIIFINVAAIEALLYALAVWRANGFGYELLGVMVTAVAILGYITHLYLYRTPRTSPNLRRLTWVVGISAGVGVAASLGEQGRWGTAVHAILLALLWQLYVVWYSRLGRGDNRLLAVGKKLPDFVVEDEGGTAVSTAQFQGQPALFMFYRGNWCPLCMAQIREIAGQYRALAQRGVQIALISPQPHDHTRKLAQRFDVPFRFLVDPGNRAARQLGIAHENGIPAGFQVLGYDPETVYPTVIITDKTGTIRFVDLTDNYRLRPQPQTFLRALDEIEQL